MVRGSRKARRGGAQTVARRPRLEPLEERQLLSNVYSVTNTLDDGSAGSLRWAITLVDDDTFDSAASPDQITFDIPQSDPGYSGGVWSIAPRSPMLAITQPAVVDGYTQPGAAPNTNGPALADNATLTVVLVGNDQGANPQSSQPAPGLTLSGPDIVVRGLVFERYDGGLLAGIAIINGNNDVVAGNILGTVSSANSYLGNTIGVAIYSGSHNTIGGTTPDARNIISGNGSYPGTGVVVDGDFNVVEGNFIGTDATGTAAVPNAGGIVLESGGGNTIGGTTPEARNIITGSTLYGGANGTVAVSISGSSDNVIEGNYIGTDVTGTVALPAGTPAQPNNSVGIEITGDSSLSTIGGNTIGGTAAGAGNVIAGCGRQGIQIGPYYAPLDTVIEGNFIGTDATGLKALGNAGGIEIDSSGATVGGSTAAARNVIAGNQGTGVAVHPAGVAGNANLTDVLIAGNFIGTDATGQSALPNAAGIAIQDSQNCTVGGTIPGAGNVIAGNTGDGVTITASATGRGATANLVAGNLIGTDATGQRPLGNGGNGVLLRASGSSIFDPNNPRAGECDRNTVGGTVAGAGNVIAFNQGAGVAVIGSSAWGNAIEENSIDGNAKLGIDIGGTGVPQTGQSAYAWLTGVKVVPGSTPAAASTTVVNGTLDGTRYATRIEFFSNPAPDPSGFGQGKTYLGALDVTPENNDGVAAFQFTYSGDLSGQFITATATASGGNTSEFSPDFPPPPRGPTIALNATPAVGLPGQPFYVTIFVPQQPLYVGNAAVVPSLTPTGAVALAVDGQAYWDPVPLPPGSDAQGHPGLLAELTVPSLGVGTHVFTAHYNGGNFPPGHAAPVTVTVVNDLATSVGLSASSNPTPAGQPVTFNATVRSAASVPGRPLPVPSGFVDFREGSILLGRVALDATGYAALTTAALGVGGHEVAAYYEGDAVFAARTSATVTERVNPTAGPTVLLVQRYGVHGQPASIVLTFSEPLAAVTAQDTNNYEIDDPRGRAIPVSAALYDAANDTVTLRLARRLNAHQRARLTVRGRAPGGVSDVYDNLLAGAGAGHPGTNYVTTLTTRNTLLGGPLRGRRPRAAHTQQRS